MVAPTERGATMALTEEEESAIRGIIEIYKGKSGGLSDDVATSAYGLFPEFDSGGHGYAEGERVRYKGVLYTCIQPHTSQSDWAPDVAHSLWAKTIEYGGSESGNDEVPEWVQPESTNPYPKGARVKKDGKVWESLVDNNVWVPGAIGTEGVWKDVTNA